MVCSHLLTFSKEHRCFYDIHKKVKLLVEMTLKNPERTHIPLFSGNILCVKWIFVKDILDNREVNNVEILEWIDSYLKIWTANWNIWTQNGNLNCLFERWTFNFEWQRSWTIWKCLSQILWHFMYENQCIISRLVIDIVRIQLSMKCYSSAFKRKEDFG